MNFNTIANSWIRNISIYEPGRPIEEVARELGFASASDIEKLASNENELGPSPKAIKAIRDYASAVHRYPDGGAYYLKEAIAKKLNVVPQQVLPVNGSNEAIEFLGHAFMEEGSSIVMAETAFLVYRLIASMFRTEVISVPMIDFTHDLSAMCDAIRNDTKVVFISNPNNPTSTMVSQEAIDAFMDRVPDHVVVCFDEAYIELLPREKQPDTLRYVRESRNVIVMRTFSKTYGLAGLRIGYVVAPEECISILNRVRQPFNVNSVAMVAAIAALDDDEHVNMTRNLVEAGLDYLKKEMDRLVLEYVPPVANFMLIKVGEGRKVFESLQRMGIIVRPMDAYGLPEYIRVTVGTVEQNRKFTGAIEKLLKQDISPVAI